MCRVEEELRVRLVPSSQGGGEGEGAWQEGGGSIPEEPVHSPMGKDWVGVCILALTLTSCEAFGE